MFDKSAVDTLKSTMPGRLPDVKQCHTRVTEWHEPAIPGDGLFVRAIDSHASYLRFCAASPPCGMRACWSVQVPDTPPGCIVGGTKPRLVAAVAASFDRATKAALSSNHGGQPIPRAGGRGGVCLAR